MKEITKIEELDNIISGEEKKLVVVKIGAPWCGPCRMLETTIEDIEKTHSDIVTFYSINVDEAETDLIEKYQVQSVPLLLFFSEGCQVDRIVGARNKTDLIALIEKNK